MDTSNWCPDCDKVHEIKDTCGYQYIPLHTCILYCRMLETEEVVKHMKIPVGTNRKVVLVSVGVATKTL